MPISTRNCSDSQTFSNMKAYPDKMSSEQARAFQAAVLNMAWAGWPSHSRMVGRTLRYSPEAQSLPCHRVVNAAGRTAPGWASQRTMLEAEDIRFLRNGHVDMKHFLWQPPLCF